MILILSLILIILLIIIVGFFYIRYKVKRFSKEYFGTDDLSEVNLSLIEKEANTPKSVSGMTSVVLPKITKDFPEFHFDEMRNKSQKVLTDYLMAVTAGSTTISDVADSLKEQLISHIEKLNSDGKHEHFTDIKIHRTEISDYTKKAGRCIVNFQSSVGCYHYITDDNDKVLSGNKDLHYQTRFNVELEYIQDASKATDVAGSGVGINCPNCGAPITSLGAKTCAYCGTTVQEISLRIWKFARIVEKR